MAAQAKLSARLLPERGASAAVPKKGQEEDECPYYILVSTYLSYFMLTCFGHLRDFFGMLFKPASYTHLKIHNVRTPRAARLTAVGLRTADQRL